MENRDRHVRVLPVHVANKIAAGEVVERPAAVVKELVENSIDAGAKNISVTILKGGAKLISIKDDGCGMEKEDALLSLERQATSKILDVDDIEKIDTLGFRGEAIPSIASVSRFTMTTRPDGCDEGTSIIIEAGTVISVSSAGCPKGTIIEVRDLFCNVPARKKFLRSAATEESHIKNIFTKHALSHCGIGFTLIADGREIFKLAPSKNAAERIREIFGEEYIHSMTELRLKGPVSISGFIEKPNLFTPTRHEQYIFVNGRAASAPAIQYAIKEAFPRKQGDVKPSLVMFVELKATEVDVNVHPTKREVKFRNNTAVKAAVTAAIEQAFLPRGETTVSFPISACNTAISETSSPHEAPMGTECCAPDAQREIPPSNTAIPCANAADFSEPMKAETFSLPFTGRKEPPAPANVPVEQEFPVASDGDSGARAWKWFEFLAVTNSGYVLIETDSGLVTINPHAARERIAFEKLIDEKSVSQQLLIPETVRLSPVDFGRIRQSLETIAEMGFSLEEFGANTFKIDAVPQIIGGLSPAAILSTIAKDLSEGGTERGGKWKAERIAKSIARSFSGSEIKLTAETAVKLVEELCACRMPYICPRGRCIMIFTSTRELNKKFDR